MHTIRINLQVSNQKLFILIAIYGNNGNFLYIKIEVIRNELNEHHNLGRLVLTFTKVLASSMT